MLRFQSEALKKTKKEKVTNQLPAHGMYALWKSWVFNYESMPFFSGSLIRCWRSTCWDIQNSILSSLLDIQPQNLLTVHRSNPLLDADLLILVNWLFLHHQSARHLSDSKPLNFFCATVFGWRNANFTDRESSSELSLKATRYFLMSDL